MSIVVIISINIIVILEQHACGSCSCEGQPGAASVINSQLSYLLAAWLLNSRIPYKSWGEPEYRPPIEDPLIVIGPQQITLNPEP